MTKGLGVWLFCYGLFLFACGAAYFVMYPNQAPTPVIAGTITGGIVAFLGTLAWRDEVKWVPRVAGMVVLIFMMFGLAMAMQQWMLVYTGKSETPRSQDVVSAVIATSVFAVSAAVLWRVRKKV